MTGAAIKKMISMMKGFNVIHKTAFKKTDHLRVTNEIFDINTKLEMACFY